MIVDVPDSEVEGVIFMLTGCNGDCGLVAPEYDGNEKCTVCISVDRNEVLFE